MTYFFIHKRQREWVGVIEIPDDPNECMGIVTQCNEPRLLGRIGRWAFGNFNMYPLTLDIVAEHFVDLL